MWGIWTLLFFIPDSPRISGTFLILSREDLVSPGNRKVMVFYLKLCYPIAAYFLPSSAFSSVRGRTYPAPSPSHSSSSCSFPATLCQHHACVPSACMQTSLLVLSPWDLSSSAHISFLFCVPWHTGPMWLVRTSFRQLESIARHSYPDFAALLHSKTLSKSGLHPWSLLLPLTVSPPHTHSAAKFLSQLSESNILSSVFISLGPLSIVWCGRWVSFFPKIYPKVFRAP